MKTEVGYMYMIFPSNIAVTKLKNRQYSLATEKKRRRSGGALWHGNTVIDDLFS